MTICIRDIECRLMTLWARIAVRKVYRAETNKESFQRRCGPKIGKTSDFRKVRLLWPGSWKRRSWSAVSVILSGESLDSSRGSETFTPRQKTWGSEDCVLSKGQIAICNGSDRTSVSKDTVQLTLLMFMLDVFPDDCSIFQQDNFSGKRPHSCYSDLRSMVVN